MPPCSPVKAGESNRYRVQKKDRIGKSIKIREITVKDKSHHATLERVYIQRNAYTISGIGKSASCCIRACFNSKNDYTIIGGVKSSS